MPVIAVLGLGYVGLPLVVESGKLGRTMNLMLDRAEREAAGRREWRL